MKITAVAFRNIKHSKSIIFMITLSVMLISAVINLGFSVQQTFKNNILENVGDNHVYFANTTEEQADFLYQRAEVRRIDLQLFSKGLCYHTDNNKNGISAVFSSALGQVAGYQLVSGNAPQTENEAAIPPHTAAFLGIELVIGNEFEVIYQDTDGMEKTLHFIISGILQPNPLSAAEGSYYMFVSGLLISQLDYDSGINIKIQDKYPPRKTAFLLAKLVGVAESDVYINENLLKADLQDPVLIGLVTVIIIILCVVGSLVIFNAYHISMARRIQQYGLLAVIGASKKQIRLCVYTEALYCTVIGLPLGLLLGTSLGYYGIGALSRLGASDILYTINPFAYLFTAFVAFAIVFIGVSQPARHSSSITAVDAIRFSYASHKPAKRKEFDSITIETLAEINYLRSKSQSRGTIMSLTLSGVLFLAFVTPALSLLNSTDTMADGTFWGDIQIMAEQYGYRQDVDPLTHDMAEQIKGLDGIKKSNTLMIQGLYSSAGIESVEPPLALQSYIFGVTADIMSEILYSAYDGFASFADFDDPKNVIAVMPHQSRAARYERDGIDTAEILNDYAVGNQLTFELISHDGHLTGKTVTFNIIGLVYEDHIPQYSKNDRLYPMLYTMQDNFKNLGFNESYEKMILFIDKAKHDDLYQEIEALCSGKTELTLNSYKLVKDELVNQISDVIMIVMLMLSVITLVVMLNLIGTTFISMEQRKKEFGILLAVGLGPKGLGKMLKREGYRISLQCTIFAALFGFLLGCGIYLLLYNAGMTFLNFTFPVWPIAFLSLFYILAPSCVVSVAIRKLNKYSLVELIGQNI